jgi:hypothetical protein
MAETIAIAIQSGGMWQERSYIASNKVRRLRGRERRTTVILSRRSIADLWRTFLARMKPPQATGMGRLARKRLYHGSKGAHSEKNNQKPGGLAAHG